MFVGPSGHSLDPHGFGNCLGNIPIDPILVLGHFPG